jgi:transposase
MWKPLNGGTPMSLQPTWSTEIPQDTAALGQQLLPEDNVYRLAGDEASEVLQVGDFCGMYSISGRGAVHPFILALVTLFQFLENIPDRVAAEWSVLRIDWKYALHVALGYLGFHHSTLSNFRKRLVEHRQERLVFEQVLGWVQGHGFLKKHGKQRTDSTHIIGCVARLSRLELVWETIRVALRALQEACSEWYAQHIPAVFDEMYRERQSDWRLGAEEVEAEMKKAGTDGYWLLDLVTERGPAMARALPEVAVLEQVLSQQYERQEGQVRARKPPIRGKKQSRARTNHKHGTRRNAAPSGLATEGK